MKLQFHNIQEEKPPTDRDIFLLQAMDPSEQGEYKVYIGDYTWADMIEERTKRAYKDVKESPIPIEVYWAEVPTREELKNDW